MRDPRIDPQPRDELRKKHTSYIVEYRDGELLSCKVIGPSSSKSVTMTLGRWVRWARSARACMPGGSPEEGGRDDNVS